MNEIVYEQYIRFLEQEHRRKKHEMLMKRYRQFVNRHLYKPHLVKEGDDL